MGGKTTGNAVVSAVLTLWAFIGLAIVCDEFFQPSLEKISEVRTPKKSRLRRRTPRPGASLPGRGCDLEVGLEQAFG